MSPLYSRRNFLQRSGLAAGALALPGLLRARSGAASLGAVGLPGLGSSGPDLPLVRHVELQPLLAQVRRLVAASDYLGTPLRPADKSALDAAGKRGNAVEAVEAIQRVLDRYCLVGVTIDPGAPPTVVLGPAKAELVEHGWRQFLVKVYNAAGANLALRGTSDQARPLAGAPPDELAPRWLDLMMFDRQPLTETLSGLALEYRIVQLYSRDAGLRGASLAFELVWPQGPLAPQNDGRSNPVPILFDCRPAQLVRWRVRDEAGKPTVAAFVIRDAQGRVYPSQTKRLAPDFAFHPQVYRGEGELLTLPAGAYTVEFWRGPESRTRMQALTVTDTRPGAPVQEATFPIERWIDPARLGWWSGDHHIHAAGCAHYIKPTEGVRPEDMFRHTLGEDLKIGANLTWGPGFDYQKQFFTGQDDRVSLPSHRLHYDVEVSGFGSDRSGHLVLLRLKEQIPPGSDFLPRLADAGPQHLALGQATGRGLRAGALGLGPRRRVDRATELSRAAVRRHRRQRIHHGRDPRGAGPRWHARARGGFHVHGRYSLRQRAQHLVSHAQRRVPHPGQRRDRFPVRFR